MRALLPHRRRGRQRGVVLIFTLIILLILTIGAVALMRSMNTALVSAGNLAFRRDLANQGEQAVSKVIAQFSTGGILANSATTQADVPSANYSARILGTNPQGVPTVLLGSDAAFAATWTAPDMLGVTPDVSIRYIIDRLCDNSGAPATVHCVQSTGSTRAVDTNDTGSLPPPSTTLYRLTVRIITPRSAAVFLQATITKPD